MKCAHARNIKDRDGFRGFHYHEILVRVICYAFALCHPVESPVNGAARYTFDRSRNKHYKMTRDARERYSRDGGDRRPRECGWHIRMEMHSPRINLFYVAAVHVSLNEYSLRSLFPWSRRWRKKNIAYLFIYLDNNYIYVMRETIFVFRARPRAIHRSQFWAQRVWCGTNDTYNRDNNVYRVFCVEYL